MNRVEWVARAASLPGYGWLQRFVQTIRYRRWLRNGQPLPPPSRVKQEQLRSFAREAGLTTLVETGTFFGDMLYALRADFRTLYSIELSPSLHRHAQRRFRRHHHIHLVQGDSGEQLRAVLTKLNTPTLFWLDGHYSGAGTAHGTEATPLVRELDAILACPVPCVIAIDDARLFDADVAYPSLQMLTDWAVAHQFYTHFKQPCDMVILTKNPAALPQ